MKDLQESISESLDSNNPEIFPFLPYILQDIWEIGASAEAIGNLIKTHFQSTSGLKILDLGCGKGAISIQIAKELGCLCVGIDAMPEFIEEARTKSTEWGTDKLCAFFHADIRQVVDGFRGYDVIILGAIGPILGDYFQSLTRLKPNLNPGGIIIIDDGYFDDTPKTENVQNEESKTTFRHPRVLLKTQILEQISEAGFILKEEMFFKPDFIESSNKDIFDPLKSRCEELMLIHPDKKHIFEEYIQTQEEENQLMESVITCTTMLLTPK